MPKSLFRVLKPRDTPLDPESPETNITDLERWISLRSFPEDLGCKRHSEIEKQKAPYPFEEKTRMEELQ